MLRFQQRKIEELQKELHRSQQQLKHQQQVILAAKKAQVNRMYSVVYNFIQGQGVVLMRKTLVGALNLINLRFFAEKCPRKLKIFRHCV